MVSRLRSASFMITRDFYRSLLLSAFCNLSRSTSPRLSRTNCSKISLFADRPHCKPVAYYHNMQRLRLTSQRPNLTQIIPHSTIPKYRLMGCSLQMSTFLSHINFHPSHYIAHNPFHQCGSPLHHSSCLLTTPSKSSPSTIHHSIPLYLQTPYLPT